MALDPVPETFKSSMLVYYNCEVKIGCCCEVVVLLDFLLLANTVVFAIFALSWQALHYHQQSTLFVILCVCVCVCVNKGEFGLTPPPTATLSVTTTLFNIADEDELVCPALGLIFFPSLLETIMDAEDVDRL